MCCLPLWTAIVRPTPSGVIVARRDQVLIGFLSLTARAASTFFSRWPSTNGPFLIERDMSYPFVACRRRTIIVSVRLFRRVFLPLAGVPHGDIGWCQPPPPLVLAPIGWSTGFSAMPPTRGQ